nr:uncharacterized mitochondrial protein AtMg00810-like [Tanacetum cinerariifolium]
MVRHAVTFPHFPTILQRCSGSDTLHTESRERLITGLQISQSPRGIFINQSKYASEIVKKYGMLSSDSVDTPLVEKSELDKDLQGKPVDDTLYRGLIGSLMYLTSSRPDLTYAVCLCVCQKFIDPPFEEEILAFIKKLGYSRNMKSLFDAKVEILPQPWRTFGTIINKCLSDLVCQIENKEAKKNKDTYYLRFTKVIINHFMSKDQLILRRNKVDWHMANDDPILNAMRFIPKHETVQKYDAILPNTLTNQAMKESDAEKTVQAHKTSLDDDNVDDEDDDDQDDDNADDEDHYGQDDEEKLDEEKTNEEEEVNELYNDSSSVSSGFISKILNPNPDTSIDFILNLNNDSTYLVDVIVITNDEIHLSSVTTLPPPHIPLIQPVQQTPVSKPTISLTNLSELELKKILIDKIESNKSIYQLVQQKTLYKALIEIYETDKVILETYGDTVTFKRRQDDKDEDEEPFARSNRGSKRIRSRKELESASSPKEKTSKSTSSSKEGSKSKTRSTDKSDQAKEEVHTDKDLDEPTHQEFKTSFTEYRTIDEINQHPD